MTFGKVQEGQFILRLEKGEEIVSTLKAFCVKQNIQNASFSGIGQTKNPTLAHYSVETQKYTEKELDGIFEVTSLLGTVAIFENEPLLHPHVTVSDETMHAFAGHLVKGTVSATLEVVLNVLPGKFEKKHDEEIGLKLYDLPEKE
jgi:uncharacterized protein